MALIENTTALNDVLTAVNNLPDKPSANLQDKTVTINSNGTTNVTADAGFDGLGTVTVNTSVQPALQQKSVDVTTNGTTTVEPDGGNYGLSKVTVNVNVAGSGKNTQGYRGYASVTSTSYTATAVKLTVKKTGTYNVSWMGWRSTNSGTSGSQLYKNGTAYGSANTSFLNTYGHSVSLSNVSLNEGDEIVVRARARSTSYVMAVGNLIIEEV